MDRSRQVFIAAFLGMLLFGVVMISLGSTLPGIIDKFQLNELDAGTLASILPFGILVGSLVFGPIADRYGYKGLLILCCILVLLGLEGIAFAGSLSIIQVAVFLTGFGGGALNGATNALVADISEGEKSANLSLLGVAFGLGALGMPVLLASLSSLFGQEQIIAGIGAGIVLVIGFMIMTAFPQPKQQQRFPIQEGLKLLKDPTLLLLGMILFFQSGVEGLVNNWTTSYLQESKEIDPQKALIVLTVLMASLTVMRLLLGKLLRIYSHAYILLFGIGFVFLGILFLWLGQGYSMFMLSMVTLGIGFASVFPIVLGKIGELWPKLSGTAFSIALFIALIGNSLLNYLMGIFSFQNGLGIFPLGLLICIGLFTIFVLLNLRRFRSNT